MSLPPLASDFMSVVMRGQFNPRTITPKWLCSKGLFTEAETATVETELLLPGEVHIFSMAPIRCEVQSDALQVSTTSEYDFERLRDLAIGILKELPEVPLRVLGINRNVHFSVDDFDVYHRAGDKLVPKEPWTDVLDLPGMKSATLLGVRPDSYGGKIEVRVEPSDSISPGIAIFYNDHYELIEVDEQPGTREELFKMKVEPPSLSKEKRAVAIDVLLNQWGPSLARSAAIIERSGDWAK